MIRLDERVIAHLPVLAGPRLSVLLTLVGRAQTSDALPVTLGELARAASCPSYVAEHALAWLMSPTDGSGDVMFCDNGPFVTQEDVTGKGCTLRVASWVAIVPPLRYERDEDEQARIALLERRIAEQADHIARLEAGDVSALGRYLTGEDLDVVTVAEDVCGRAMTYPDVWFLSRLVTLYGPKRVVAMLRTSRKAKDPLRYAYRMLEKGKLGKNTRQQEEPKPTAIYRDLDNEYA